MKKSKVVKMLPFHKEEEKKKLPHPADAKCMINNKQYFVSTFDTVSEHRPQPKAEKEESHQG
jgi:hypothetical protein